MPIVPGTRVTDAHAVPPHPPHAVKTRGRLTCGRNPRPSRPRPSYLDLDGQISATPERANNQARVDLRQEVTAWLEPDVPHRGRFRSELIDSIVLNRSETVPEGLGPDVHHPLEARQVTGESCPIRQGLQPRSGRRGAS